MEFKTPFITRGGVIASEHFLASRIGLDALDKGGNAVDAAAATSLALSVLCPHLSGLGGDFFALYLEEKSGRVYCINGSGYAPLGLTVERILEEGLKEMPERGPLSITIPGYLYGLYELQNRFGSLDFEEVVEPSINLAGRGFPATKRYCNVIERNLEVLSRDAGSIRAFLERGTPTEGELIRFQGMAKALYLIKEKGVEEFYEGEIGKRICEYVRSKGGVISEEDMKRYRPEWVEPVKVSYRDYEVYEVPPNSMGITTLLLLNMFEELGIEKIEWGHPEYIRTLSNAFKAAYEVREENVADPRFYKADIQRILSKEFAKELTKRKAGSNIQNMTGDTTYFATADAEGNIVSAVQSLFLHFGSGLTEPEFGITLNCRARGFKLQGVNRLEPWKRPMHTLSAMVLTNETERIALGASAGDFRAQVYSQLVSNYVDYGMGLQGSIEAPRFFLREGNRISKEEGLKTEGLEGEFSIEALPYPSRLGVAQGIRIKNGVKWGSCDVRGDGLPMGQYK